MNFIRTSKRKDTTVTYIIVATFSILETVSISRYRMIMSFSRDTRKGVLCSTGALVIPTAITTFGKRVNRRSSKGLYHVPFLRFIRRYLRRTYLPLITQYFDIRRKRILQVSIKRNGSMTCYLFFVICLSSILMRVRFLNYAFSISRGIRTRILPRTTICLRFQTTIIISNNSCSNRSKTNLVSIRRNINMRLLHNNDKEKMIMSVSTCRRNIKLLFNCCTNRLP